MQSFFTGVSSCYHPTHGLDRAAVNHPYYLGTGLLFLRLRRLSCPRRPLPSRTPYPRPRRTATAEELSSAVRYPACTCYHHHHRELNACKPSLPFLPHDYPRASARRHQLVTAADDIRFFQLNTGAKMPSIGFGTGTSGPVGEMVTTAIKVGYRHLDCGQFYCNQAEIGYALKKLLDDGVVKREDLWITSKLWCTDHDPEDVPKALDTALQELQLDYVDLYLIHWPVSMKKGSIGFVSENNTIPNIPENLTIPNIPSTWRAMEALYDSGKARAIGVSNFSSKKLQDLLKIARVPPAVNQVELHPMWQQPKLHEFCESKGIHLSGYSPFGSPELTNIEVLKNPVIIAVAEKIGKTPAQVALRWGLQMGHSVLPKSRNEERIKNNFDVFGWSIPDELMAKFSEIKQERLVKGTGLFYHEIYGAYKTLEELWDGE